MKLLEPNRPPEEEPMVPVLPEERPAMRRHLLKLKAEGKLDRHHAILLKRLTRHTN